MSYKVSQLRKGLPNQTQTYMQNIPVEERLVVVDSPFKIFSSLDSNVFQDFALCTTASSFNPDEVYYLRGQILRVPQGYYSLSDSRNQSFYAEADDLKFTILLADVNPSGKVNTDYQELSPPLQISRIFRNSDNISSEEGSYITASESQKWYHFQIVFKPKKTYNHIVFKMERNTYDVLGPRESTNQNTFSQIQGKKGRHWLLQKKTSKTIYTGRNSQEITVNRDKIKYSGIDGEVCLLKNIASGNHTPWKKFGIQSRPGTLIVVNDQPIYIGRSGIYQLNNGTDITSFMITAPGGYDNNKIDAYLLDYMYEDTKEGQE